MDCDQGRIQGELQGLAASPQWKMAPLRQRRRGANFHLHLPSISALDLFLASSKLYVHLPAGEDASLIRQGAFSMPF